MKHDVMNRARKQAAQDARGRQFESMYAMRKFLEQRTRAIAKHLHATDKSHLRGGEHYG